MIKDYVRNVKKWRQEAEAAGVKCDSADCLCCDEGYLELGDSMNSWFDFFLCGKAQCAGHESHPLACVNPAMACVGGCRGVGSIGKCTLESTDDKFIWSEYRQVCRPRVDKKQKQKQKQTAEDGDEEWNPTAKAKEFISKDFCPGEGTRSEFMAKLQSTVRTCAHHHWLYKWQEAAHAANLDTFGTHEIVIETDFSEKYKDVPQDDLTCQQYTQTSLMCAVVHYWGKDAQGKYSKVCESYIVVSEEQNQDAHFHNQAMHDIVSDIIRRRGESSTQHDDLTHLHLWTDGCQGQYRGRRTQLMITEFEEGTVKNMIHNYMVTAHFKGNHDGEGMVVKSCWRRCELGAGAGGGGKRLPTGQSRFEYAKEKLCKTKCKTRATGRVGKKKIRVVIGADGEEAEYSTGKQYEGPHAIGCRNFLWYNKSSVQRGDDHNCKPPPSSRQFYQLYGKATKTHLGRRKLSCYMCSPCQKNDYEKCKNYATVMHGIPKRNTKDGWSWHQMECISERGVTLVKRDYAQNRNNFLAKVKVGDIVAIYSGVSGDDDGYRYMLAVVEAGEGRGKVMFNVKQNSTIHGEEQTYTTGSKVLNTRWLERVSVLSNPRLFTDGHLQTLGYKVVMPVTIRDTDISRKNNHDIELSQRAHDALAELSSSIREDWSS
jgi:hypothetical protein